MSHWVGTCTAWWSRSDGSPTEYLPYPLPLSNEGPGGPGNAPRESHQRLSVLSVRFASMQLFQAQFILITK